MMSRLADGGRIGVSAETTTTGTSDLEAQLDTKHPLTPVETTQAVTGSSHLITSGAVRQSVAAVIDSAPAALDTLNELAAALNNDANFAAGVTTSLASKENVLTFTTGAATGHGTLTRAGDTITFAPPVLPSGTPASAWSDYGQSSYDASNRLDAAFVGDGTVSDAEYAHLNGVTSSIQTQLDVCRFATSHFRYKMACFASDTSRDRYERSVTRHATVTPGDCNLADFVTEIEGPKMESRSRPRDAISAGDVYDMTIS